jgi:para-nitrobenzyl esterase
MSGGGLNTSRPGTLLDTAQVANKKMMDFFQKTTLEEMRALSFEELLTISAKYADTTKKRIMMGPVVDGYLLNGTFSTTALANEIADIPYMIGFTANDMNDATQAVKDFCALRAEKSSKPVYAYLFARPLPGDDNGAWHSCDLWYVFHSFRHPNGKAEGLWTPYTKELPKFMIFNTDGDNAICTMSDAPEFKGPSPRK